MLAVILISTNTVSIEYIKMEMKRESKCVTTNTEETVIKKV